MTSVIREHAPGVFEIPSEIGGTIRIAQWVVVSSGEALLVDTGIAHATPDVVQAALAEASLEITDVTGVLLTHCDVDHCGGTSEILERAGGCAVYAPAGERPLIESWPRLRDERYRWIERYGLHVESATEEWLEGAFGAPISVTREVADGDTISVGETRVQIVGLAGHSPALVGAWLPATRTLIAMDAVFGRGSDPAEPSRVTPPQYGDVGLYEATIERVSALSPVLLGSSHFEPLKNGAIGPFLADSRNFIAELHGVIRAALGTAPLTLAELTDAAAEALGPFRTDFHELTRSVHAHLTALVEEGQAEEASHESTVSWRTG